MNLNQRSKFLVAEILVLYSLPRRINIYGSLSVIFFVSSSISESYRHSFFFTYMSSFAKSLSKVIISLFLKKQVLFALSPVTFAANFDLFDSRPKSLD